MWLETPAKPKRNNYTPNPTPLQPHGGGGFRPTYEETIPMLARKPGILTDTQ